MPQPRDPGGVQAPFPPPAEPERILLLIQNRENARLLAEWLALRYEVLAPEDFSVPDAPFDLCILDGPSLERLEPRVVARKAAEGQAFLPFLLVTLRRDLRMVNRFLYHTIDELIFMPIEKVELQARIEILLRARRSSVQLQRQGEDLFAALVEQALTGVYLCWNGRYHYFNEAGAAMFGYTPEQILRGIGPLDLVQPDDRPFIAEQIQQLESGEAPEAHYLFRGRRADGSVVHLEAFERRVTFRGSPMRLGTLMDVSERLSIEEERARHQEERIETLQRADALKDEFLGILSHELRTPINAITGFGSILDDDIAGSLNPQQRHYVRKMLAGAEVLLALVNDLLDMSRIQAGKFSLEPRPLPLASIVDEAGANLVGLAERKRLSLKWSVPKDLSPVLGDRQRIGQVLTNLIGNAIKFTPEGGAVVVRAIPDDDGFVRVEVVDTGYGIAEGNLSKLFQRFTQLDMTRTRRAGGTGLGLSISKALVEAQGGTIGVHSQPGVGSTFWFTLPVAPEDATD